MSSFRDGVVKSYSANIHFIQCRDRRGRECFYFIQCRKEALRQIINAKEDIADLEQYGRVIASGFGHVPSSAMLEFLHEKFDFDAESYFDFSN